MNAKKRIKGNAETLFKHRLPVCFLPDNLNGMEDTPRRIFSAGRNRLKRTARERLGMFGHPVNKLWTPSNWLNHAAKIDAIKQQNKRQAFLENMAAFGITDRQAIHVNWLRKISI